jgi:hypothetical protein
MDTFVVRVYRSEEGTAPDDDRLRGVVEDISSGFHATFHDSDQLLAILRRAQHEKAEGPPGRAAPRPLLPTTKGDQ